MSFSAEREHFQNEEITSEAEAFLDELYDEELEEYVFDEEDSFHMLLKKLHEWRRTMGPYRDYVRIANSILEKHEEDTVDWEDVWETVQYNNYYRLERVR